MRATFQRPEIKSVGVRVGEITGLAFRVKSVADQCSLKMPSTGLISAGLMRWECATVTECTTPSSDFCQSSKKPAIPGNLAEVVVLPDVGLQQPGRRYRMFAAVSPYPLAASENLVTSRGSPGPLMGP